MTSPLPPVSLGTHLADLQRGLDDAADDYLAHRRDHGCREGQCAEGKRLSDAASDRQFALSMTRFLNEE